MTASRKKSTKDLEKELKNLIKSKSPDKQRIEDLITDIEILKADEASHEPKVTRIEVERLTGLPYGTDPIRDFLAGLVLYTETQDNEIHDGKDQNNKKLNTEKYREKRFRDALEPFSYFIFKQRKKAREEDDEAALYRIFSLVHYKKMRPWTACKKVARSIEKNSRLRKKISGMGDMEENPSEIENMTHRFYRKFKKAKITPKEFFEYNLFMAGEGEWLICQQSKALGMTKLWREHYLPKDNPENYIKLLLLLHYFAYYRSMMYNE